MTQIKEYLKILISNIDSKKTKWYIIRFYKMRNHKLNNGKPIEGN